MTTDVKTWVIAAHGNILTDDKYAIEEITLPMNVIVIMPCFSTFTYCDRKTSAALHSLVSNVVLPTRVSKATISQYIEFVYQSIGEHMNEFCIFVDKCPNIQFKATRQEAREVFTYVGQVKTKKGFVNTSMVKTNNLGGIVSQISKTRGGKTGLHIMIVHTCAVSPHFTTDFQFSNGIPISVKHADGSKVINPILYDIISSRMI